MLCRKIIEHIAGVFELTCNYNYIEITSWPVVILLFVKLSHVLKSFFLYSFSI